MFLTSPLHYFHLLQRPAQCKVLFITNFSSQDFSNVFLDCTVYTTLSRHASYFGYTEATCRGRGGSRGCAWRPSCANASGATASNRNPFWCHWQSRQVQVASHLGLDRGWPLETVWQIEVAGRLGLGAGGGRGLTAEIFSWSIAQA